MQCDLGYLKTTEKMPHRRVRAHYEQLSEFERGRIIGLKKGATNPASNCTLTTIEDVSGDGQGSVPILLSLSHATQALNKELCYELSYGLSNRSPDPSPIKHVWAMMGRRLHLPRNVDYLARQLEQIWQEIPQQTIRVLYHSMSRRVVACIQARDGSPPY
ncbi:transposable element Tcb1 transposase [Trichonephila clavipes]|nr:transposable element Tcb1 transposase [Trichonephila clavipes]